MATRFDILIQRGLVVTGSGIRSADVGIKGEQIVSIESGLSGIEAGRKIDASGKYVMPGVIDVPTHPVYEDDLGGLALTAAHGGTTFLIHYAYAKPGMKLIDTIKKFKDEGSQKSYVDFGIHGALFDPASQIDEIPKAFDLGVTSFGHEYGAHAGHDAGRDRAVLCRGRGRDLRRDVLAPATGLSGRRSPVLLRTRSGILAA